MRYSYIVILIVLIIGINIAFASPGRLDSNGCHTSKTEGYHCHRSQTSSSSASSTPISTTPTSTVPSSLKGINLIGEHCDSNSDCRSNFCVHSLCQNQSFLISDGFCDEGESCINSPNDCDSCENNGKCDVKANENCQNSKDCLCSGNQLCNMERLNTQPNGCYSIKCGDGFVDNGETTETCCLDVKCQDAKSLIKENFCNQNTKKCDIKIKNWLKITGIFVVIFVALLIYNRTTAKKTHRYK